MTIQSQPHKTKIAQLGFLLASACMGLTAWSQDAPQDGVYKDRIDWGLLMDMSGPTSASQGIWVNGFRDHMRKINESGGIHGRKINVLAEDNRFNPATDKIAFEKLVSQTPVIAISGMGSSVSQVALAPTIKAGKVPIVGTYTDTKALSEPVTPMVYNGFCGYKQMAQAGVGYHVEKLKLKSPKVVTLAVETAGGKEYHEYVSNTVAKYGGTSHYLTVKVTAVDVTPQILEIMNIKPDFITIYGVSNTAISTMKALMQYGLNIPVFGITYLGSPQMFQSMGAQAAANYKFISCFTPGGSDQAPGNTALSAYADSIGRTEMKQDINYVAGWVTAQMAAESLAKLGTNPSRARLVESLSKGFSVNTEGLTAPFGYTPKDNTGPAVFKMFGYDFSSKKFKAIGEFSDYEKYTR
jgi:branched-chain amino acid transport system substrate-binding protein